MTSTSRSTRRPRRRPVGAVVMLPALLLAGCEASGEPDAAPQPSQPAAPAGDQVMGNRIIELLEEDQAVFGLFSGDHTREQGALMATDQPADFIFFSLESGPFDLPGMEAYLAGMVDAAGEEVRNEIPLILRIPPIRDSADVARDRVAQARQRGVRGIVYPHVETPEQAALSADFMGTVWPRDANSALVNVALIEDRIGVDSARAIVSTPGLTVAIPGPGDLRRAYEGDMEAVEAAIQQVLAACLEFDVPCGITANANDVAARLEQGFRFIIASDVETIRIGKQAAGRS